MKQRINHITFAILTFMLHAALRLRGWKQEPPSGWKTKWSKTYTANNNTVTVVFLTGVAIQRELNWGPQHTPPNDQLPNL